MRGFTHTDINPLVVSQPERMRPLSVRTNRRINGTQHVAVDARVLQLPLTRGDASHGWNDGDRGTLERQAVTLLHGQEEHPRGR